MVREMSDPERSNTEWTRPLEAHSPRADRGVERYIPLITPLIPSLVKINWKKMCGKKKGRRSGS